MTPELHTHPNERDKALRRRAERVVPGGMYGHSVQKFLWPGAPQFWDRGLGSHVWDVDGTEYIDLMCSWGPLIHGHRHPIVEDAVSRQMGKLDTGNGPTELFVELGELLVDLVTHAAWTIFAKNGGDVTTLALTVARAATGRSTVLVAEGTYHGSLLWASARDAGIAPGDRAHVDYFRYNDLESLQAVASAHADDIAAVIVTPVRHEAGDDQELALPEFAHGLRSFCDTTGALLILDEVRTGFRLSLDSSWTSFGVLPDLSCWSKAIANGYPLSALLGSEAIRDAARAVFKGGTFWMSAVPMAAALATLALLREERGVEQILDRGQQLMTGIRRQAAAHQIPVRVSGPPSMPYLSFDGDVGWAKAKTWAAGAAARGLYVNPSHNWFISTALTLEDVSRALEATGGAFDDLSAVV